MKTSFVVEMQERMQPGLPVSGYLATDTDASAGSVVDAVHALSEQGIHDIIPVINAEHLYTHGNNLSTVWHLGYEEDIALKGILTFGKQQRDKYDKTHLAFFARELGIPLVVAKPPLQYRSLTGQNLQPRWRENSPLRGLQGRYGSLELSPNGHAIALRVDK